MLGELVAFNMLSIIESIAACECCLSGHNCAVKCRSSAAMCRSSAEVCKEGSWEGGKCRFWMCLTFLWRGKVLRPVNRST